jgi:hypothetical protein
MHGKHQVRKPVVVCDYCYERIEKGSEGNVYWQVEAKDQPADGAMFYAHKTCDEGFQQQVGTGRALWWMELSSLPIHLATDLEVDWEKETEKILGQVQDTPDR